MSLYLLKPIVWNDKGYLRPGGGKFTAGYPKDNGFGHEEWNAAPHWEYTEDGEKWRCFHTENVEYKDLHSHAGDTVVFMIASHEGNQYLVGVAGMATSLFGKEVERKRLARMIGTASSEHAEEAWAVDQVKAAFNHDKSKFMKQWRQEAPWGPTWRCPAAQYLWLDRPMKLDSVALTQKSRLVTMYSSYQRLNRAQAEQVLLQLQSAGYQSPVLSVLIDACTTDTAELEQDVQDILDRSDKRTGPTQKLALIQARRGQGQFRTALLTAWGGCAVTGCTQGAVLRASHIRSWKTSSDKQRLDPANGLLLVANLDALFDRGWISFSDEGYLLCSQLLSAQHRMELGLGGQPRLRKTLSATTREYLESHRALYRFPQEESARQRLQSAETSTPGGPVSPPPDPTVGHEQAPRDSIAPENTCSPRR